MISPKISLSLPWGKISDTSFFLSSSLRCWEEEGEKRDVRVEELETIVVPAQAEGFQSAFIESNAWWAIRISFSMLNHIKYIAVYQVAPISAITHVAEVSRIEKYKDTNKYIVYFKESAREINPVKLDTKKKGSAP
ncbi:MAG: hypothetical protein ACOXZO_00780 [Bacteroidales bacterium]|nr:hypothetical protein [Bacteroidales bacterium]